MNYESFFGEAQSLDVRISFDNPFDTHTSRLSNEALFHLPLLAITVLMLSKSMRKPRLDHLGQLVGECFERTFAGFKGSSQHLGWSANLRMRTVRALTFLETARLVEVDSVSARIEATRLGKSVVEAALRGDSDLAFTLRVIDRNYRNISVERQLSLGL